MIQPLALGGITYGVSDLELTAAYAAIADGGQYRKPVFLHKGYRQQRKCFNDNTENKGNAGLQGKHCLPPHQCHGGCFGKRYRCCRPASTICTQPEKPVRRTRPRILFLQALRRIIPLPSGQRMIHTRSFRRSDREFHKRLWAKVMNEIHEGLADMDFETSATDRRQRSVRRLACSPAQAARPSPNTLRYPICRPSVARATTPRRPQHRRRPEPLLQHQLRRQPRHRRRHRRKLRLRPKHLPIRLLIHRRLLTHRIPLMHRQNRIPRRRYRKYSCSPKRAALPNNFFSQVYAQKPALWHMPAGPVFLYFFSI